MSGNLNEKIIESLKQLSVKELPDFKITSGMISGINIKDGNVQFLLELNENYKNHSKIITKAAELKVSCLDGINSVTAIPTSHKNLEVKKYSDERKINGIDKIIAVASGKGGVW